MSINKLLEKDEVWLQCTPEGDYDMADAARPDVRGVWGAFQRCSQH